MIETWRDSWFEEGMRLFYLVPPSLVSGVLPITVTPAPSRIVRVFVGRMEILTGDDDAAVRSAAVRGDAALLERYGRFLGPLADGAIAKMSDEASRTRLTALRDSAFAAYLRRAAVCE
jgi:hypothetical protein